MWCKTAVIASLLISPAAAAEMIVGKKEINDAYYIYNATIPDVLGSNKEEVNLNIRMFISDSGDIGDVQIMSSQGVCNLICWKEGNPPQKMCVVPIGCPGSTGGGGVLLERPFLLEMLSKPDTTATDVKHFYDVRVRELGEVANEGPQTYQLQLEGVQ